MELSQVPTHLRTPPPTKHPENSPDPPSRRCTCASRLGLPTPLLISPGGAPGTERGGAPDPCQDRRSRGGGCGLGRQGDRTGPARAPGLAPCGPDSSQRPGQQRL